MNFQGGAAYSAYFPIHDTGWYMVSILPASHITDAGRLLMVQFILIYLLFVLLAMFIRCCSPPPSPTGSSGWPTRWKVRTGHQSP